MKTTYDVIGGRVEACEGRSGKFVHLSDYEALEAQAERLQAAFKAAHARCQDLEARLKTAVFAGDAVEFPLAGAGDVDDTQVDLGTMTVTSVTTPMKPRRRKCRAHGQFNCRHPGCG